MIEPNPYFVKMAVLTAIFIGCIVGSAAITHVTNSQAIFFRNEDEVSFTIFDSHIQKWKKLIGFTTFFITIIGLFIALCFGITWALIHLIKDKNANAIFINLIWKSGKDTMLGFYIAVGFALLGMLCFYILYTLLVKDYITNITYEIYHPDEDKTEFKPAVKYIIHYSFSIVIWLMLFIIFVIMFKNNNEPNYMVILKMLGKQLVMWMIPLLILGIMLLRYYITEQVVWFCVTLICVFIVLIANKYLKF